MGWVKKCLYICVLTLLASCNVLVDGKGSVSKLSGDCKEVGGESSYILFIGNELLSNQDIPKQFKDIACSLGKKTVIFSYIVKKSNILSISKKTEIQNLSKARKWDYVIIQENSKMLSKKTSQIKRNVLDAINDLTKLFVENNSLTKVVLIQPWALRDGDSENCAEYSLVCDNLGQTQALEDSIKIYASESNNEVFLIGNSFLKIKNDSRNIIKYQDLWSNDGYHSSASGTYLSSLVLFAKIYNSSPVGAMPLLNLNSKTVKYLQVVAQEFAGF